MTPTMIEETNFPAKKMYKIILSVFFCFFSGGNWVFVVGIFVGVWIVIGSCLELELGGYISLGIYIVIGLLLSLIMNVRRKKNPGKHELITLTPDDK